MITKIGYIFFFSLLVALTSSAVAFISKKNSQAENSFENKFQKKIFYNDNAQNLVILFEDNLDDDDIVSIKKKSLPHPTFFFKRNINSLKSFCTISKGNCYFSFSQLPYSDLNSQSVLRI